MDRFKGLTQGKEDSLAKRAALALAWLLRKHGPGAFVSWVELYGVVSGVPVSRVDPDEVLRRLRSKGMRVKLELKNMGLGWDAHRSDQSLIRATRKGEDSLMNCQPRLDRRALRAAETAVEWSAKTVGDMTRIQRTKENADILSAHRLALPRLRSLLLTAGLDAKEERSQAATKTAAAG